jgi:hypothetical protein
VDQPSGGNGFGVEAGSHRGVGCNMAMQDLDRHWTTKNLVVGTPHFRHCAAGDVESEPVPTAEESTDHSRTAHGRGSAGITLAGNTCR